MNLINAYKRIGLQGLKPECRPCAVSQTDWIIDDQTIIVPNTPIQHLLPTPDCWRVLATKKQARADGWPCRTQSGDNSETGLSLN